MLLVEYNEDYRKIIQIISKTNNFEIITYASIKPRSLHDISNALTMPYTTVISRVTELEKINVLESVKIKNPHTDKRIKKYRTTDFLLIITPKRIAEYLQSK